MTTQPSIVPAATSTQGPDLSHACLGIELGSTRIKAVLAAPDGTVLATGGHTWANELVDGVWTYSMDAVERGLPGEPGQYRDLVIPRPAYRPMPAGN